MLLLFIGTHNASIVVPWSECAVNVTNRTMIRERTCLQQDGTLGCSGKDYLELKFGEIVPDRYYYSMEIKSHIKVELTCDNRAIFRIYQKFKPVRFLS